MPTVHTLCYSLDAVAPTGGLGPKILPKMAIISVSGVLRPNYCGVACLLLLMDVHSCC